MKGDERHVPAFSAAAIPTDTLAVSDEVLKATRIATSPTVNKVLVAKAERAAQLLE